MNIHQPHQSEAAAVKTKIRPPHAAVCPKCGKRTACFDPEPWVVCARCDEVASSAETLMEISRRKAA